MNLQTTPARHLPSRGARLALIPTIVATLAILFSTVSAPSASAAVAQNRSGYTGGVSLNGALTTGRTFIYYSAGASYFTRWFATAGVTVSRAGGYSGSQTILGSYVLQRAYNGSWQNIQTSGSWHGTVSGAGRLSFPAFSFTNPPQYTMRYAYRIVVALVWSKASTGAVLGGERVVASQVSENACNVQWANCEVYADSVVM